MYRIKTQDGKVVTARSFHFGRNAGKIYADVKDTPDFKLDDCVVCGTYSPARVLQVFNEMAEFFRNRKGPDGAAPGDDGFVYEMPKY